MNKQILFFNQFVCAVILMVWFCVYHDIHQFDSVTCLLIGAGATSLAYWPAMAIMAWIGEI